ncbi:MAG: alpha/beta hydrolase [Acidobacteriaceae bacterium]
MMRPLSLAALVLALLSTPGLSSAQTVLPLWPQGVPESAQTAPPEKPLPNHPGVISNVSVPTLTLYRPHGQGNGAAVLVFPGGGYHILAWNKEGLDPCHWLNSLGVTCVLVKYRIPQPPGEAGHYPADPSDLEDAQQAMRITRAHAAQWNLDPARIGVMGFSAGANLAVLLCTHPDDDHITTTPAASQANTQISARADFAILAYPAYLAMPPDNTEIFPAYQPNAFTPATFIIQAENDRGYGINGLVYYRALMQAHIPAELHYYATGGHGFGMDPQGAPEDHWSMLAAHWLRSIHVLSSQDQNDNGIHEVPNPCMMPDALTPNGRHVNPAMPGTNPPNTTNPANGPSTQNQTPSPYPNCWHSQP